MTSQAPVRTKPRDLRAWRFVWGRPCALSAGVAMITLCSGCGAVAGITDAIDRGKVARTMRGLRDIAVAVEAYRNDVGFLPTATDLPALQLMLVPKYLDVVVENDGWGHRYAVSCSTAGYTIESFGKGGVDDLNYGGANHDYEEDLVLEDGDFTQWPRGMSGR